jgi:hypothetical protein
MDSGTDKAPGEQSDYHAFMVRVWRGPAGWQGELYSLQGAATVGFVGLPDLLRQLAAGLGASDPASAVEANE